MWFKRILLAVPVIAVTMLPTFASDAKPKPQPLSSTELAARIDEFIESDLAAKGIEPAPLASDAEFHRRVYLDLGGRIPTGAEVRAFLADKAPERRTKLVEALLGSPHYVRHMANTWQTVMAPPAGSTQAGFRTWLDTRVRENAPYDSMVRDLLTAPMYNVAYAYGNAVNFEIVTLDLKFRNPNPVNPIVINPNFNLNPNKVKIKLAPKVGDKVDIVVNEIDFLVAPPQLAQAQQPVSVQPSPGAFFFEANEYKPENLAASTARRFLGIRLECAQCHNHPFSSWTRKQFWEFAAFFSGVQAPALNVYFTNQTNNFQLARISVPATSPPLGRAISIPGTDKVVEARFPDGKSPVWKDKVESRQALAEWLTAPSNPYFARTAANRLWAHFFGAGIIDPVDDEPSEDNPASHPELLAELTAQFVASKYDVKYLIRAITASKVYQRTSAASHASQNQPRLFASMAVKGLTPEQLFDSLALATGFQDPSGHQPGVIVPNTPRGDFLAMFSTQDKKTETQTSILQALTLMNGKLVADATSLTGTEKLLIGAATNADKLETLYLSTLSRLPRPEESSRMLRYLDSQPEARAAFADVFWALLNSSEFRFNH
jgi:hypothetical protein